MVSVGVISLFSGMAFLGLLIGYYVVKYYL